MNITAFSENVDVLIISNQRRYHKFSTYTYQFERTGSKRASGSEPPEAHTYGNLSSTGAVDAPDSGLEWRRQLEEEAARRAQVEQDMRKLQARELDAKRYSMVYMCLLLL